MDAKYENVEDDESKEEEPVDAFEASPAPAFDPTLGYPRPTRQQIRNVLNPLPPSQLIDLLIPFIEKDPGAYARLVEMSVSNETFRKVFVHGLPPLSIESDLRALFEQYGQIESISVPMESAIPPRCKGYAFVVYSSVTEAQMALLEPRKWFGGKEICCKLSVPTNPSVDEHTIALQNQNRRIFVSGLRYDLPEKEFVDYFARFGAIETAQLITEDGVGKGYGFITYAVSGSAREAIAKTDRKVFQGRPLTVAWCRKREDEENKMRRRRSSTNVFQDMQWPPSPRYSMQNTQMTSGHQGQWYGFPYLQAEPFQQDPFIYVPVPMVQGVQGMQNTHGYMHETEQNGN